MDSKITEITAAQKENAMVDLSDISAVKGKYGEVYEIGTVVDEDDESEGDQFLLPQADSGIL